MLRGRWRDMGTDRALNCTIALCSGMGAIPARMIRLNGKSVIDDPSARYRIRNGSRLNPNPDPLQRQRRDRF